MFAELVLATANRLLTAEAWARQLLRPHAGQTALLELAGLSLRFTIADDGHLLATAESVQPDLRLRIPLDALGRLSAGPEALRAAAHIEGNAAFAEALASVFAHLRPDLAAWLAPRVGDILARRVALTLGGLGRQGLDVGQRLGDAGAERLRGPAGPLVGHDEMQVFNRDLAALGERLARLENRLAR